MKTTKPKKPHLLRTFLLSLFLLGSMTLYGQTAVHGKSITPLQAISQIQSSGYTFLYNADDLKGLPAKDISCKGSIQKVLNEVFDGTGVVYRINGKQVILRRNSAPRQQKSGKMYTRQISGYVRDINDNQPIIGATVSVRGTKNATVTDTEGRFTISFTGKECNLDFSYIGYKPQSIYITDQGMVTVKLHPSDEQLSEVIVVGAGTQKKISVTGAFTSLKGSELYAPSSSLTNNLAGKLAGVISVTNSGEPGSASSFYIRGISTFGGRTKPLILLDGVEISTGDLNNIPPETIQSFSILKDASATAIYGARGANGVMLITTKSGIENSKAHINVTFEAAMLKPTNVVEFTNGPTYMETYNEALQARNPGSQPRYSEEQIANTRSGVNPYVFPNVDWYNLMYRDYTASERANINVQGGGSRVTYYMSLQANHDGGILDVPKSYSFDNNYNRWLYTFQNNIGYKLTSSTKVELRMNAQIINSKSPGESAAYIFNQIFNNTPVSFPATYPREKGDKHVRFGSAVLSSGRYYTNPYAAMLNTYRESNANKLNVSLGIDQKLDFITKGLSWTALVNFNNWSEKYYTRSLSPYLYGYTEGSWNASQPEEYSISELQKGTDYISQSGISRNSDNTFYFDTRVNYDRRFGQHAFTGMLMYMMREYRNEVLPNRNQGFSGRLTYDYDSRYLAEFNFGYNGTERLKQHRFEFFPALSIGWVASGEKFWQPVSKYIDYFKVRSSYGLVGSDETGSLAGAAHFLYLNTVNMYGGMKFSSGYQANLTMNGPVITQYAVQDPHWERAKEFDLGIDMRILNQINITLDYYHNKRERILMRRASFPAILGYSAAVPYSNIGKVDSKGFEISVNWEKRFSRDLSIDIRANYTYSKNQQTYIDEPDYPYSWQRATGRSVGYLTGFIAEGLFTDQEDIYTHADQSAFGSRIMPGDIKYKDINGDCKITDEDKVALTDYGTLPRIQYGFGISIAWKKLDANVFFNGSAKRHMMINNIYPFGANDSNDHNLMKWIYDEHWREASPNPQAKYPRLGTLTTQIANNMQPSSYWMRSTNFLRFKTLEIGYKLRYCRVYFSGDNLAVWSPFKLWDPELWYNSYPLQRTFNLGVQFNF
ncbi:MAG: TonB-dependent receptor [Prevotella sp.]|nr:TonB-dependent receptor [Prevotella sp.]